MSINAGNMAEAAAVLGLVSSIASLVDLIAKIVSRLREFTSKTSDVPGSFRALSTLGFVRKKGKSHDAKAQSCRTEQYRSSPSVWISHLPSSNSRVIKHVAEYTCQPITLQLLCYMRLMKGHKCDKTC
jgi:hypothetical protein